MDNKFYYLAHSGSHKYTAKEWIKGKWRYFYDNKLGGNQKKYLNTAIDDYLQSEKDYAKAALDFQAAQLEYNTAFDNHKNLITQQGDKIKRGQMTSDSDKKELATASKKVDEYFNKLSDAMDKASKADTNRINLYNNAVAAQKAYDKTVLGKLEKGRRVVSDIFSRLRGKRR